MTLRPQPCRLALELTDHRLVLRGGGRGVRCRSGRCRRHDVTTPNPGPRLRPGNLRRCAGRSGAEPHRPEIAPLDRDDGPPPRSARHPGVIERATTVASTRPPSATNGGPGRSRAGRDGVPGARGATPLRSRDGDHRRPRGPRPAGFLHRAGDRRPRGTPGSAGVPRRDPLRAPADQTTRQLIGPEAAVTRAEARAHRPVHQDRPARPGSAASRTGWRQWARELRRDA